MEEITSGRRSHNVGLGMQETILTALPPTKNDADDPLLSLKSEITALKQLVTGFMVSVNERLNAIETPKHCPHDSTNNHSTPTNKSNESNEERLKVPFRLSFIIRESSWPSKGEELLVISGLNPDEQVDENKLEYLSQSLAAWDADDDCPELSDIYDLIEILKQSQSGMHYKMSRNVSKSEKNTGKNSG